LIRPARSVRMAFVICRISNRRSSPRPLAKHRHYTGAADKAAHSSALYSPPPQASTRPVRRWENTLMRAVCITASCGLPAAASRRSTLRERARPPFPRAPPPRTSTHRARSTNTTLTRAMWLTATCGLATASSRRSTLRLRGQALARAPSPIKTTHRGDHWILY
jgi:hypothetical protein